MQRAYASKVGFGEAFRAAHGRMFNMKILSPNDTFLSTQSAKGILTSSAQIASKHFTHRTRVGRVHHADYEGRKAAQPRKHKGLGHGKLRKGAKA